MPFTEPVVASANPTELAQRVESLLVAGAGRRVLIGIVGAPGGGKSHLAQLLVQQLGDSAVQVPMDGFHLAQAVIDEAGLAAVKGAPQTFDAGGYVALLTRLRDPASPLVYAPTFRRDLEEPIAGAIAVRPKHRVVVTEGNYLLLDEQPWAQIPALVDAIWFLDTPEDIRLHRLIDRHVRFGRSAAVAQERASKGSDADNAKLILASRCRAQLLLQE